MPEILRNLEKRQRVYSSKAIIYNGTPEVLLVHHRHGEWILPGGKNEPDEGHTVFDLLNKTLWRELREELGLSEKEITELKQRPYYCVGSCEWYHGDVITKEIISAIYLGGSNRLGLSIDKESDEIFEAGWFNPFHFPTDLNIPRNTLESVKRLMDILTRHTRAGYRTI